MAVHLNARLKTRFIPALFAVVALTSLLGSLSHANGDPAAESLIVPREELDAVMSESVDPSRLDRRPGISPITIAMPGSGEQPAPGEEYPILTDQLPAQPSEAEPLTRD
jgi:hypothetical protein